MRKVLYYAPGGGMGHLTRALAVCLELRKMGVETSIVSNSPYAEGLARLARQPVIRIRSRDWSEAAPRLAEETAPAAMVIDTFPRGMREEWAAALPCPAILMARRMKAGLFGTLPALRHIVAAEPLATDQEETIRNSGIPVTRLPGPVRLRPGTLATPPPEALLRMLDAGADLIVHSGPRDEVESLRGLSQGAAAILTPEPQGLGEFEYYPAGNLVARARRIISGAGYNIFADLAFARSKHTALPFERQWDDQAGRIAAWRDPTGDGTTEAAGAIAQTALDIGR